MSSFGEQSSEEMISTTTTSEGQLKASEDPEILPQRAYYGLHNQGATCYLNSVLQVLYMTTEMHHRLDPKSQITDQELGDLFEKLKESTCTTGNITRTLEIKNVKEQRDAAECLEMILYKVSPQASGVFQGQLRYTTKCSKDHIINEETNPFWTLPLSLQDTPDSTYSVENHFKRIFHEKTYDGDNKVYCNECGDKTEAKSRCEMVGSPQILILLLKRFDFDFNTMSHFKSDRCVDVPCELQTKVKTYKLYGMVNHMGGLNGGHYTSTILSDEDKSWYEFNDTSVTKVKEQPFAETKSHNSGTVYLLMYRATESQMSSEAINPDDLRGDDAEQKERNSEERVADNEDETPVKQSEQDEVQAGSDEVLNHQTRGEREETGEKDLTNDGRSESEVTGEQLIKPRNEKKDSVGESPCDWLGSHNEDDEPDVRSAAENSHDVSMKTGESCDLKSGGDEEGQGNQSDGSQSNIAQENTTSKSEESKETRGEDVEEQSKDSCEQHLDKETEPVMQKQRTVGEVKTSGGEEAWGDLFGNREKEKAVAGVGEQLKVEQLLDKQTKTWKQKQSGFPSKSTKSPHPVDATSENHTDVEKEDNVEGVGPEELKGDDEHKQNASQIIPDDEETTQTVPCGKGEGQMRGDKEDEKHQIRGEEGEAESVENDTSVQAQGDLSGNEDGTDFSIRRGNREPEEFEEVREEDAVVGVGEQSKDSSEQRTNEETTTETQEQGASKSQKPAETTGLADEVEEEQGEDKLKGGEVEHGRKTGEIDDGDGERESEEQMKRD